MQRVDYDILCVVATKKLEEFLLSLEGVLEHLESEEGGSGQGVRGRLGGIGETAARLVQ
jgi:hypothetical protein